MTRLAAVLARALREHRGINGTCPNLSDGWSPTVHDTWEESAEHVVAAIPEPEREAMEAALDVCQYVYGTLASLDTVHCRLPEEAHGVGMLADHAYQPLVAP